ncbi:MAG: site-2 protease family protein [Chloracidobacterium sp.]|nr:site-2 protease family protein [Chloracidobacterium sp.]
MTEPDSIEQPIYYGRPVMKPTVGTWIKHLLLLGVTFCTATIAGTLFPFGRLDYLPQADPQSFYEFLQLLATLPTNYAAMIGDIVHKLFTNTTHLIYGLQFSISLLFILICHEMGHYIACRIYRVDATLPFFLPTPPMIGPAGTFGAFIKILSPMPTRRAVFDIGVAGPIAGFIALLPIAMVGLLTMQFVTPEQLGNTQGTLTFTDPLLIRLFATALGVDLKFGIGNAFYFAAWVGLLVTALNLIPSGQLDGGHAIYAVFGEKVHYWTGRIAFAIMATLSVLGMYFYGSPSGFLIAIILAIMMKVRHPTPWDTTPLDKNRKVIAFLTLVIFILCFVPFPIQIN